MKTDWQRVVVYETPIVVTLGKKNFLSKGHLSARICIFPKFLQFDQFENNTFDA